MYVKKKIPQSPQQGAPSMFPQQGLYGERCTISRANGLFIHLYLSESPKRSSLTKREENIRSPSTEPPCRLKAYKQWVVAWFPMGIVTTLLSLPQYHAAFSTIPSTLAWVDQRPISQRVLQQPSTGYTLHNCYHLPRDPGQSGVQIHITLRYR